MKQTVWIEEPDALALHDRLLALNGGAPGVRDGDLLKSALARRQHFASAKNPTSSKWRQCTGQAS